jgi:hypothetical protein
MPATRFWSSMIAFAAAGFFWLAILIWLSGTDFVTRAQFPPHL